MQNNIETQLLGNKDLLDNQANRESNARTYPRAFPLAIQKAQGVFITDMDGKKYIDCLAGAGTLALGHNHKTTIQAIENAIAEQIPLHTLDITTPVKEAFIDELFACLPKEFSQDFCVHFCGPTGADGVEAAIKLAKIATGRSAVFSFQGGYHGSTHLAMSLSGNLKQKGPVEGLVPNVHFMPYPYSYRCPFGLGGELGETAGLNFIQSALSDPESGVETPAAFILEAVQGEGGVIPASDAWLQKVREMTAEQDIPLIIDEVQTGFGRTGKLFAFEHAGITPDILVLSKAIGGSLPLSVIVYRKKYDQWLPGAHIGTFRGNQLAMAAGTSTLKYLRENAIPQHATTIGSRLKKALNNLKNEYEQIGDIRGKGLMLGVEMVQSKHLKNAMGHATAAPDFAQAIQQECFNQGLIIEVGGRHCAVLRFLPPLIINDSEMDQVIQIFSQAVATVCDVQSISCVN